MTIEFLSTLIVHMYARNLLRLRDGPTLQTIKKTKLRFAFHQVTVMNLSEARTRSYKLNNKHISEINYYTLLVLGT